jgi:hypothetical protein
MQFQKLSRHALPITLTLGALLVVGLFLHPSAAFAQTASKPVTSADMMKVVCQGNAACQSFDPSVNPMLKGYKTNTTGPTKGAPQDVAGEGKCVPYNSTDLPPRIVNGCLNNGVFSIDGFVSGAADAPPTSIKQDSNGNTTVAAVGALGPSKGCSITDALNPSTWGDCLLDALATFLLGLANFLLGLAGVLLNWVIVKTVFQFSQLIGNTKGLLLSWGILRDIGNLILLFGFVLMGIGTILNTSKLPDKKAIPMLIIFAVLLNFSLFATEAVIDISNVLTATLYSQANTDPCQNILDQSCAVNHGIAGHIMQATGLSGIYGINPSQAGGFAGKLWVIIALVVFALVGTVVLMAAAIMLAWRAIVLTGLIIVSPLGFAGMAIPPLAPMAKKWWSMVIHQSFFAPILFLLIFVTLKVTDGFSSVDNNNSLANALANGQANGMGVIMVFLLVTGGLIASLMAAKSFGAMGADMAIKAGGGLAFGTVGFVGRRTIGAGSAAAGRAIRSSGIAETRIGRTLAGVADYGASSSFDARGKISKLGSGKGSIDLGKPGKIAAGGIAGIEKAETKARVDYAKSMKMSEAQERRKEELDPQKTALQTKLKTEQDAYDVKTKEINTGKNKLKGDWKQESAKLDGEISTAQQQVDKNANGEEVRRVASELSVESIKRQRLMSEGNMQEAFASDAKVKRLEKERDELATAPDKLKTLIAAKAKGLKEYNDATKATDEAIENATAEINRNKAEDGAALAEINAEINSIDPKKRQERYADNVLKKNWFTGGRPNSEAVKAIKLNLKKSKEDTRWEALTTAVESGDKDKVNEAILGVKEAEQEAAAAATTT